MIAQVQESPIPMWIAILVGMALLPFLLTMVTCFAKLVIVGGILRQALGTPQIPPTSVITGLALILTLHIMAPVGIRAWNAYSRAPGPDQVRRIATASAPVIEFLETHSSARNRALFESLSQRLETDARIPADQPEAVQKALRALVVTAPAFMLTELSEAFQIGFLLFIPFLVLDLIVSNILLAMGMHMLSPTVISLPLKLLLFVLVDGWALLLRGLVLGYQ